MHCLTIIMIDMRQMEMNMTKSYSISPNFGNKYMCLKLSIAIRGKS